MDTQLNRQCLEVLHAGTVKDFSRQLFGFTQNLGFGTVSATVVTDHTPTLTEFQTVSNAPAAYLRVFEDLDLARIDPVSQHCKQSAFPIVWNQQTYTTPCEKALWETQAQFGYRSGIAVAMHLGRGRHFLFGAEWDESRCEGVANYKNIFADLMTFAAHAQAAAFELSMGAQPESDNTWSLSKSELETLRWTMDGKTSWEIAKQMSMSERHATLLLRRAMQKLDCTTKYETVLRAIRLGLIDCKSVD